MRKVFIILLLSAVGFTLYAQSSDQLASFQFSKAPNTAHLEESGGKSFAMEADYLNMTAKTDGIEVSVNMFGLNPVWNRWNGKTGIVLSLPVSYLTAETDSSATLESSGLVIAPSLGGAFKLAGELDASNLMGFGGLTITPASLIWLWETGLELLISMPSISFHVGLKGNILMKEYSLGAMFDFKEDSSSFSLHFRIPISKSYTEG